MKGVSSSLGVNLLSATSCVVTFMLLVGPVPPRGKSEICFKFNPGFNPFRNFHNRPHAPFLQLIYITGISGPLRD